MVSKRDKEVQIEVTSRHQPVSDKTRAFASERALKLTRFNDRISRIQIILAEEHSEFIAEVIVHVDTGTTLVGKEAADGYRTSLDVVLMKIEKQLKKDKEKRRNHKHDGKKDLEPLGPDVDSEATYEDVVQKDLRS